MDSRLSKLGLALLVGSLIGTLHVGAASAAERTMKRGQNELFVGIIHRMPRGNVGLWQIGSHTFEADAMTQFDTHPRAMIEPVSVGSCAQVELRGPRARKIYVLPAEAC